MRLEPLSTPSLVSVAHADGTRLPALLLARRGDRRYVQVRHGPGLNHLRWVDAAAVAEPVPAPLPGAGVPALPWRQPRAGR